MILYTSVSPDLTGYWAKVSNGTKIVAMQKCPTISAALNWAKETKMMLTEDKGQ